MSLCRFALCCLQVQPAQAGVGWARTKAWVETAAAEAPSTTEALLHSFITSSDSLPGATAPSWLRDDRPGSPRMGRVPLRHEVSVALCSPHACTAHGHPRTMQDCSPSRVLAFREQLQSPVATELHKCFCLGCTGYA